jgi:hypothetical protein
MIAAVKLQPWRRPTDGRDEPTASSRDRGYEGSQSIAGDAAMLLAGGRETRPALQAIADPLGLSEIRSNQRDRGVVALYCLRLSVSELVSAFVDVFSHGLCPQSAQPVDPGLAA